MVAKRFTISAAAVLGAASILSAPASATQAGGNYGIDLDTHVLTGSIYDRAGGDCIYGPGAGGRCVSNSLGFAGSVDPMGGNGTATRVIAAATAAGAGATAESRATVDLSDGSIHLYGADSNVTGNCSAPLACGGTNTYGHYFDTLHFSVPGAGADTITPVQLTFRLDGTMVNSGTDTYDSNAAAEVFGQLTFGHSDARFDLKSNAATGYVTTLGYLDTYPSNAPGVWVSTPGYTSNTYTETYFLTGASGDIGVELSVNLACSLGYVCDYSHTAKFGLVLPAGASFSSDSGVFLTAPVGGAVPEPASWALLVAGFGVVGAAARRRRTPVAA